MANLPNGRPFGQKLCAIWGCNEKAITEINLDCEFHVISSIRCEKHFQNLINHVNGVDCCEYKHFPL